MRGLRTGAPHVFLCDLTFRLGGACGRGVAKIFISYTAKDREWAQWIGVTLRDNGHVPFVHEWEIGPGENIPQWMDDRIKAADRLLGVFSDAYAQALHSSAERWAAYWNDPDGRKGFLVPVEVEKVSDWPPLAKPLKRLSLVGLSESQAQKALLEFLEPPKPPLDRPLFPGGTAPSASVRPNRNAPDVGHGSDAAMFTYRSEQLPANRPGLPSLVSVTGVSAGTHFGTLRSEITYEDASVDPTNRQGMRGWLETKPLEWSVVIAARAALRVLPLSRGRLLTPAFATAVVLPIFRAAAIARFASLWAIDEPTFGTRAEAAATAADDAALSAMENSATYAAGTAHSVAAAVRAAIPGNPGAAADSAVTAIAAAVAGFADTRLVVSQEMLALHNGTAPALLARTKVRVSTLINDHWKNLASELLSLGDHWQVWIDWYNEALDGSPPSPTRNKAWDRAFTDLIAPLPWDDGPRAVNSEIKTYRESALVPEPSVGKKPAPNPLDPVEGVHAPLSFAWSDALRITVVSGTANWPVLPLPSSERDHAQRLDTSHTLARDLAKALAGGKYNAREEYGEALRLYDERLPTKLREGNILLADAEARTLRQLFAAETSILPVPFAARLKILLEQHIGLRVFYPEIARLYSDVKTGTIETPLPQDAVDGFMEGVHANTPEIFDPSVTTAVAEVATPPPAVTQLEDAPPIEPSTPMPPPDPLGELDPHKTRAYSIAGTINELWKAFRQGETIVKDSKAWYEAYVYLSEKVGPVLDWLRHFFSDGGDGTPPMPPTAFA